MNPNNMGVDELRLAVQELRRYIEIPPAEFKRLRERAYFYERQLMQISTFLGRDARDAPGHDKSIAGLVCEEIKRLQAGIAAVSNLINESQGVAGLHLNGDEAPWEELLKGGKYEEWLRDFSDAVEAAKEER